MEHPEGSCGVGWVHARKSETDGDRKLGLPRQHDQLERRSLCHCHSGHEISPNFGNDHDKFVTNKNIFPWGLGYHMPGLDVRTLMASAREGYFKMINFYSNPDVKFKGVPTGVKGAANAARVIRENRFAIAAIGDESEECGSSSSSVDDNYDYGTVGRGGFFAK